MSKSPRRDVFEARLAYSPETGLLTWKVSQSKGRAGRIAGHVRKDGYIIVGIDGDHYLAHRLAWLAVYGEWPDKFIDHVDGNPSNNRIANLRLASPAVNSQNVRVARCTSVSGVLGVRFRNDTGKWIAKIQVNGKRLYLGSFNSDSDAHAAYVRAKRDFHEGCSI